MCHSFLYQLCLCSILQAKSRGRGCWPTRWVVPGGSEQRISCIRISHQSELLLASCLLVNLGGTVRPCSDREKGASRSEIRTRTTPRRDHREGLLLPKKEGLLAFKEVCVSMRKKMLGFVWSWREPNVASAATFLPPHTFDSTKLRTPACL